MPVIGTPIPSIDNNLIYIRELFVKRSGRAELVSDFSAGNYGDNGADFFINGGQKWLDLTHGQHKSIRRHVVNVAVGSWYVAVQYLRAVKKLRGIDSDGDEMLFEQAPLFNLLNGLDVTDSGTPQYWASNIIGVSPSLEGDTLSGLDGTSDLVSVTNDLYEKSGILLDKPTDSAFTLQVYGRFWSPTMVDDEDKSYWTVNHPNLLIIAALRELEIFYNNMTGVRNWTAVANDYLFKLNNMEAEREEGEEMEVVWG